MCAFRGVGLLLILLFAFSRPAPGWQFNVDGATDEAGPCHPDGCGYQREGAVSLALLPSGEVAIGGGFRELSQLPGGTQAEHNWASAGVALVSPAGLGSEVWRHSPITVPAIYAPPDGVCHLGLVVSVDGTADGDLIATASPCKQFPSPGEHVVVRLDGATGALEWSYDAQASRVTVNGTSVLLTHEGNDVVALDAATGSLLWNRTLASLSLAQTGRLALTSGGDVVLLGAGANGPVVLRLDGTTGATEWTYTLTPLNDPVNYLVDVTMTAADDVLVAGTIAGGANGDFGVVKLSGATGAEQWRFGKRGNSTDPGAGNGAGSVVVDGSGDIFLGGTLTVTGHPINPIGNPDAAVVKVSSGGVHLWTRTFDSGGNTNERVAERGLAIDSAGNVVALLELYVQVGPGDQRRDPAIVKLDTMGQTLWLRRPQDTGGALPNDYDWVTVEQMRLSPDDVVVATGSIFSQKVVEYDYDAFVWRIWPNGSQTPCFDGNVDPGEACDDGNLTNGDGCDSNCTVSACGNGIAAGAEACDDGNAVEGDGCDSNCTLSACGNGVTSGGEACDDGNLTNGDGCDANCTVSACGNGIAAGAEACDDGNQIAGDSCDPNCTVPACGNGVVAGSEACDDGNLVNGDGCESNCTIAGCGNGSVGGGETCDDGNTTSGDGCDANCVPTGCGNGIVSAGEICDDGNLTDGDGCDANCRPTGCGNGILTGSETCDDGNLIDADGCDHNCRPTGCGNGVKTAGEQCDDGNLAGGDGCEPSCLYTVATVAESVGPGGTVSTDTIGAATAAYPVQVSVTTPTGGDVSIIKLAQVASPSSGYSTLGMIIQIDAPPATSPADPLEIALDLDASLLPPGGSAATLDVFKDGVPVPDCSGAPDTASPDPCVGTRQDLPSGDAHLVVLTTTASAWALAAPTHDAVVRSPKPLSIDVDDAPVVKALKVQVINGDPKGTDEAQTVQLSASTDCPGSTISAPDFDPDTPGVQDTVTLDPGKKGKPALALTVNPSGVTGINAKAPVRCSVTLSATLVAPTAGVEGLPTNNTATFDVDLFDEGDPGQSTSHESVVDVLKPLKLKLGDGDTAVSKTIKFSLINADILPAPESGHSVTLSVDDGTCPAGTVNMVDADSATDGEQSSVLIAGGGKSKATVTVNANRDDFTSGGSKAPARCTALLTVTGPGGEVSVTNDTSRLVIDVFDQNDY